MSGEQSADTVRPGDITVLSLFDKTGVMVMPWLEAGFKAIIVDIQHPEGWHDDKDVPNLARVGADLRTWTPPPFNYGIVFAFPPCTHLANSGARWFKGKGLRELAGAIELVAVAAEDADRIGAPYMIENPVGTLGTYWRKPDHVFDPYEFGAYLVLGGDAYTKRTWLWTGNGFVFPPKRPVPPVEGSKMHFVPPSAERANIRSTTPEGFARAVFAANYEAVLSRGVAA
jgi:hypothetical protein